MTKYTMTVGPWLKGQADADTLIGGAGGDTLLGGSGNDKYVFTATDLRDRVVDTIHDADGQGRVVLATAVAADGALSGERVLDLGNWTATPRSNSNDPQAWTNAAGFTLTAIGQNHWTLSGASLPLEAQVALEAGNTLSLNFGKAGSEIRIQDWAPGALGINLPAWVSPNRTPADTSAAKLRDLTLLQIAAGVDLYNVIGGDASALKNRLTALPARSGTADRLTPAQADHLLGAYDIVAQYGNDGAGFSATVFKRKPVLDANGVPLVGEANADPYVLAFRGNDLEPDRVGGVAKDGGLAALREINRYGFAWAQLDAMERFWYGLSQGKVLNRAGQRVNVAGGVGAASGGLTVIGTDVGAHLASAFTLLHEDKVAQGIGIDGPGLGGMSNGAGGSQPITAAQLRDKLQDFIKIMAYRGLPLGSSYAQAYIDAGVYGDFAFALDADRPSEVSYGALWSSLGSSYNTAGVPVDVAYGVSQGWENSWDGTNTYASQLYRFAAQWLSRDTVGAGQGTLTPTQGDGVGDVQLLQAWNAFAAAANVSTVTDQAEPGSWALQGIKLAGAAGFKFTNWSMLTDRLDAAGLVSGQGYGGAQVSATGVIRPLRSRRNQAT